MSFTPMETIKGVHRGPFETANGWQEVDYGHICPDCITEEEEINGSGEMIMGGAAIGSLIEGMVEESDE